MRVIFTHFNQFSYLQDRNSISRFLLFLSAFSWKHFYPQDTVVLYGDEETIDYVNARPNICFWNEVNTVFDRENLRKSLHVSENYWAWPRVYTALLEQEPCCIVDIDIVLVQDFKQGLDFNSPWAVRYSVDDPIEQKIHKIPEIQPLVGEWYYCGGLIYHPHPEELREITQILISLDSNVGFQQSVKTYGYPATIIGVEQNIPCHYYEDLKGYKTEELNQSDEVEQACQLPRGFYHAMGKKYTDNLEEKIELVVSLARILQISPKTLITFLQTLDFDEKFYSRCASILTTSFARIV